MRLQIQVQEVHVEIMIHRPQEQTHNQAEPTMMFTLVLQEVVTQAAQVHSQAEAPAAAAQPEAPAHTANQAEVAATVVLQEVHLHTVSQAEVQVILREALQLTANRAEAVQAVPQAPLHQAEETVQTQVQVHAQAEDDKKYTSQTTLKNRYLLFINTGPVVLTTQRSGKFLFR